mgnify:CR=1 FL=1
MTALIAIIVFITVTAGIYLMARTFPLYQNLAMDARDWARRAPDQVAMREKDFGIWQEITWSELWEQIVDAGHGFAARLSPDRQAMLRPLSNFRIKGKEAADACAMTLANLASLAKVA